MTTLTQGKNTGEFLLSEGNGSISREEVVIAAAAGALVPGTVVGKITASGKYAAYSNANSDGTETAVGILYEAAPDLAVDQKKVIFTQLCEVVEAELTGIDSAAKTDLGAKFVKFR